MRLKTRIVGVLAVAALSLGLATGGAVAEESGTAVIDTTVTLEGPPPSGMCTVSVPGGTSVSYTDMQSTEGGFTDGTARIDLELGQTILPGSTVRCNLTLEPSDLESETKTSGTPIGTISKRTLFFEYFENPNSETPSNSLRFGVGVRTMQIRSNASTAATQPARLDITIEGAGLIVPPDTYHGTITLTASQGQ